MTTIVPLSPTGKAAMPPVASFAEYDDRVRLRISGALDFRIWRTVRDAREAARHAGLPLHVELAECDLAEFAGFGALLRAADLLGQVTISGCSREQAFYFSQLSLCRSCTGSSAVHCPKQLSA